MNSWKMTGTELGLKCVREEAKLNKTEEGLRNELWKSQGDNQCRSLQSQKAFHKFVYSSLEA